MNSSSKHPKTDGSHHFNWFQTILNQYKDEYTCLKKIFGLTLHRQHES